MFLLVGTITSCDYQPIYEREPIYETALIPVKINWSKSGFEITDDGKSKLKGSASVHRATLRFFPKDGSEPFERYLEGNVVEGEIDVPIGDYSVIVMNESITDSYWLGSETSGFESISFTDIDNYEKFSAQVKTHKDNPAGYYFNQYESDGFLFMQPPLLISTWSLDDFTVTSEMANYSQKTKGSDELTRADIDMFYALTRDSEDDVDGIDMRKLTYTVQVTLQVKNLTSASTILGGLEGFVNRVNLQTGYGYRAPSDARMLQYFKLDDETNWYDENGNSLGDWQPPAGDNVYEDYIGETSGIFLTFGREQIATVPENYSLDFDFIYITGERLQKEGMLFELDLDNDPLTPPVITGLPFDITDQVMLSLPTKLPEVGIHIDIPIIITPIELEYKAGDIIVNDWGDDTIIEL